MKRALLLLLLFVSAHCFCQQDSITNRLCVKIAPLPFIGAFVGPSARVSLEYKFKDDHALQGEFGMFFSHSKGYVAKLELKQYFRSWEYDKSTDEDYISGELFYKYQSYTTSDSFGVDLKEYRVTKNVECFTLKLGRQKNYKCGFVIDSYVGLGIRFQQNKNTLDFIDNENMESTSDYGPNLFLNQAKNTIYPNFTVGFKIGFRILK